MQSPPTMRLSEGTIQAAFEQHATQYGSEKRWDIGYHVECWGHAVKAFEGDSNADFAWLYGELRRRWQVFRSRKWDPPSPEQTFNLIRGLSDPLRSRKLADFAEPSPEALLELWKALVVMSKIKKNGDGPSIVALSKFLHFWNPRLFVIADRAVVWDWVLAHRWIRNQIEHVMADLVPTVPTEILDDKLYKTKLWDYLAVLVWGGRLIRDNPSLPRCFAHYVAQKSPQPTSLPLIEYQGAALEWLLLGLVELPPAGVVLP